MTEVASSPPSRPLSLPALVATASAGLFTLLFFQQANRPYVVDEAEFPLVARGIAQVGRPVYYRGEDLPANLGIWHPPLYSYTLAVWEQLFGTSHVAVRTYGLVCFLAAAVLGWMLVRRLFPRAYRWVAPLWVVLFLGHPYAVQSSLLPDIDSTVLVLVTMAVFWLVGEIVVGERWTMRGASVVLGLALGAAFLGKLTTPIALVPVVVAALALRSRSIRETLAGSAIAVAVAATLFCVVWGAISRASHVSFTYPFRFSYTSATTKSSGGGLEHRFDLLWPPQSVMFWIGPLFLLLFCVGLAVTCARIRTRPAGVLLLSALFAILVFFTYNEVTTPPFGYPKYYVPALGPALLVVLAPVALLDLARLRLRRPSAAAVVAAAVAVAALVAVSYLEYARRRLISLMPGRPWWFLVLVGVAALVCLFVLFRDVRGAHAIATVVVLASLVLLGATDVSEALYQRSQPDAVRYFPGERDEGVTIEKIRELLLSQRAEQRALLISGKDIGYEAGVRYYEDDLYLPNPTIFARLVRRHPGIWLVTRSKYDYSQIVYPRTFMLLPRVARKVWVSPSGDFTIWRGKTPRPR